MSKSDYLYTPAILSVIFLVIGFWIGFGVNHKMWQQDAVNQGVAEWSINSKGHVSWRWIKEIPDGDLEVRN